MVNTSAPGADAHKGLWVRLPPSAPNFKRNIMLFFLDSFINFIYDTNATELAKSTLKRRLAKMSKINFPEGRVPEMKCPQCGLMMEYKGVSSTSNLFVMNCRKEGCGYQSPMFHVESRTSASPNNLEEMSKSAETDI